MDLNYIAMPEVTLICEQHRLTLMEQQLANRSICLKYLLKALPIMKYNKLLCCPLPRASHWNRDTICPSLELLITCPPDDV